VNQSISAVTLGRLEDAEEKLAVGTLIVPPKGSIIIQDLVIRNLTDVDLEFWVRVNERLRELAVSKIR